MNTTKLFTICAFSMSVLSLGQTTTETFENQLNGSTSFTSAGYSFDIVSQIDSFRIQASYPGTGWNGTAEDNAYIDNTGYTNLNSPYFSIKSHSTFKVTKFWIFLSSIGLNQSSSTGTLIITGKLNGVTQFTTTKTSGFNTTYLSSGGPTVVHNGYTLIDLTNLNDQDYSQTVIDEIQLKSTDDYLYMGLDAFTWSPGTSLATHHLSPTAPSTLYPNPTHGPLTIKTEKDESFSIYSLSGQLIKTIAAKKGENTTDVTELPNGVYILKSASESHQFIKQ